MVGILPDADGVGVVLGVLTGSWERAQQWYGDWHHVLGHSLVAAVVVAVAIGCWCRAPRAAALALVTFHLHLVCDVIGSRGPDGYAWPIPYLAPFHAWEWTWDGQWALNAWPNTLITAIALVTSIILAIGRGRWMTELVSPAWDARVVEVFRRRLAPRRAD